METNTAPAVDSITPREEKSVRELSHEEMYHLLELKALEGIEEKFRNRLKKYGLILTIPVLIATFFGYQRFDDWLKETIDERVKSEVTTRLATLTNEVTKAVDSERTKLEAQIEKTMEASISARATTEEAKRTLNELRAEARASENSVVQLRNDATSTIRDLTTQFNLQKKEIQKLNAYVKNYYEGRKTEKFKLNQSPNMLAVPLNEKQTLVLIRLAQVPIASSLSLQYHLYAQPPDSYFVMRDNIVGYVWGQTLKAFERQSLYVTYAANQEAGSGFKSMTVKDGRVYADDRELFGVPSPGK